MSELETRGWENRVLQRACLNLKQEGGRIQYCKGHVWTWNKRAGEFSIAKGMSELETRGWENWVLQRGGLNLKQEGGRIEYCKGHVWTWNKRVGELSIAKGMSELETRGWENLVLQRACLNLKQEGGRIEYCKGYVWTWNKRVGELSIAKGIFELETRGFVLLTVGLSLENRWWAKGISFLVDGTLNNATHPHVHTAPRWKNRICDYMKIKGMSVHEMLAVPSSSGSCH